MKPLLIAATLVVASMLPAQAQATGKISKDGPVSKDSSAQAWASVDRTFARPQEACDYKPFFLMQTDSIAKAMESLENLIFGNQRMPAVYRYEIILDMVADAKQTAELFKPCAGEETIYRMYSASLARSERLLEHAAKALGL